ncbi:GNAT family N-acetyltransferase [Salsipaludibacter albus]|uniref:GNAT family N-acetyltransferase n=1 Tax=Salsipaludibacter albus TaxID=2849650 RepID=UPI001EE4E65F|nr:GNAT family protein [Salsipaludibacter albus]MBY5163432.1 GNAT family N-acetyltransferase [Salsipaludibacter albus]
MADRPNLADEIRLRLLTLSDLDWVLAVNDATSSTLAPSLGFDLPSLADDLDTGRWAAEDRWGWAIMLNGEPVGFILLTGIDSGDAVLHIRLLADRRGQGIGREVLRKIADHHFADDPDLSRIAGQVHERNLPMQRAFNAAGFRMEARYRDWVTSDDAPPAELWAYALTRRDWEADRHRPDGGSYDLHGLVFDVEDVLDGPTVGSHGLTFRFLQEGARVTATFASHEVSDGELAGILHNDVVDYRYVQDYHRIEDGSLITGTGRLVIQTGADGNLQLINDWTDDDGREGRTLLHRRGADPSPVVTAEDPAQRDRMPLPADVDA